jgi:hypothetical protein
MVDSIFLMQNALETVKGLKSQVESRNRRGTTKAQRHEEKCYSQKRTGQKKGRMEYWNYVEAGLVENPEYSLGAPTHGSTGSSDPVLRNRGLQFPPHLSPLPPGERRRDGMISIKMTADYLVFLSYSDLFALPARRHTGRRGYPALPCLFWFVLTLNVTWCLSALVVILFVWILIFRIYLEFVV